MKQILVIRRYAVAVLIAPIEFYKMADCCRPKVASDVISGQKEGLSRMATEYASHAITSKPAMLARV